MNATPACAGEAKLLTTQTSDGRSEKPPLPANESANGAPVKEPPTSNGGKGAKNAVDKKITIVGEDKVKVEFDLEVTELLGSVTTQNCPGTRTSARVIQKMKQDQSRPLTPPPNEREHKKDDKNVQKTPSQPRAIKPTWTNLERNHFFDALNEYGKDFEAIGNYINAKLKRKSTTDSSFKTKDQVRQHYFQTYHKIYKYIKFSDEIKKPVQELYGLINYGEMRRKLQFVTDKHFMKLKNLVYKGYITVRCKGKNIRIKTPSCKALRKLNQLDDSLEDIRLPSKIEVIVGPANMESFGRVQMIAQNPRARTTVPLHKKLVNFIKTFQYKWRSAEMKLAEEEAKLFPDGAADPTQEKHAPTPLFQDPEICFLPKPGVTIHRPLLNITEYLSSVNICLSAYEDRMQVKVRSDTLVYERNFNKRPRTDSGSEKRSPDTKKHKVNTSPPHEAVKKEEPPSNAEPVASMSKSESSGDELFEELNELLADPDLVKEEPKIDVAKVPKVEPVPVAAARPPTVPSTPNVRPKRGLHAKNARSQAFKPLISEDVIKRIREGWTISNAADITIGDLYVILGQDSKLELEYYWSKVPASVPKVEPNATNSKTDTTANIFTQKQSGIPYNPNECDDPQLLNSLTTSPLGNKLKHLLLIANLSERIRKRQCSCGHTCDRYVAKSRFDRQRVIDKSFVSNKTFPPGISLDSSGIFRQPFVPIRRPIFNIDPVKQLTSLYRSKMSRETLVQRLLLPDGDGQTTYDLVDIKNLQNRLQLEKSQDSYGAGVDKATLALVTNDGASMHANPNETEIGTYITLCGLDNVYASPSASTSEHGHHSEPTHSYKNEASTSSGLPLQSFNENALDDCSNASLLNGMSPMHLLRDSNSNSRWLEENINDFSLTSLLGHLDEINSSRDILDPSSNLSVISESSVDYRQKFQEITALMQSQDKD